MKKTVFALALAATCFGASADELIVSTALAKSGQIVGLDLIASGNTTALEFKIPVAEGSTVDLSRCVADLPASHKGQCGFNNGVVIGLVFSDSNALLQAGTLRIGTIAVTGNKAQRLAVSHFDAVDVQGRSVASKIRADEAKK